MDTNNQNDSLNNLTEETKKALLAKDAFRFRELSGKCSDTVVLTQDEKMIQLALITYSFNKILSKVHFQKKVDYLLENTVRKLDAIDFEGILTDIDAFDREHGFFEGTLVGKARIKIGARLYAKGISLAQSASLVKVRVSDILEYVGDTRVHDGGAESKSVKDRLNIARRAFK